MLHGDVLGKNKKSTSRFKPRVGKSNGRCTRYVTYKSLAVKRFFANVTPLLLDSWDVLEQDVFRRTKRQDVGRLACIVWLVLEPVGSSGGHAERLTVERLTRSPVPCWGKECSTSPEVWTRRSGSICLSGKLTQEKVKKRKRKKGE